MPFVSYPINWGLAFLDKNRYFVYIRVVFTDKELDNILAKAGIFIT